MRCGAPFSLDTLLPIKEEVRNSETRRRTQQCVQLFQCLQPFRSINVPNEIDQEDPPPPIGILYHPLSLCLLLLS